MKPIIHNSFQQGSLAWEQIRKGRVGGSSAAVLLPQGKSESGLGVAALTMIYTKVSEIITDETESFYVNDAMRRGTELEPFARREYENSTFQSVDEIGYISLGNYFGYSPDGFVGDDGLIEIKCPGAKGFVEYVDKRGVLKEIPKNYYAQMQFGLFITSRKYCDYIVYHPGFKKSLIIERIEPDITIQNRFAEVIPAYISEIERVLALFER